MKVNMSYLIEIDDVAQGKKLLEYLKTLDYVKVIDKSKTGNVSEPTGLYNANGKEVDQQQFNRTLENAENSRNIDFDDAVSESKKWKNEL